MRGVAAAFVCVLVLVSSGCSNDPARPVVDAPTAAIPTLTDGLGRWLKTERQERLADLVVTTAKEHGWAAGCVFRYHADQSILDEFPRPPGKAAYSFVSDPRLAPAIVVFVEGPVRTGGSFNEVLAGADFCYVPE
ncbi:MAG: hypothetical protein ABI577_00240 [bacterium]